MVVVVSIVVIISGLVAAVVSADSSAIVSWDIRGNIVDMVVVGELDVVSGTVFVVIEVSFTVVSTIV